MRHNKIITLLVGLFVALSASAQHFGTVKIQNTNGDKTSDITAEAIIDDGLHRVTIGNGQNACIAQYTEGIITVPGTVKVGGTDYTVIAVNQLAFRLCTRITEVVVEEKVEKIGDFAFVGCTSLNKVTLPTTLTSIGGGAFVNLPSLTQIVCKGSTPPTWGYNDLFAYEGTADATSKLASQRTLYIPYKSGSSYKASKYNDIVGWTDAFGHINEATAPSQVLEISSFEQLEAVCEAVNNGTNNYGDYTIRLTTDLVFDNGYGSDSRTQWRRWTPIGTAAHPFRGIFDGGGHMVKNLKTYGNEDGTDVGLFGYVQDANIGNLVLQNISVKGKDNVGLVAGTAVNSQIHDILVLDAKSSQETYYCAEATAGCAGGIAGKAQNSTVINCYFYGKVKGTTAVGGIVGNADGTGGMTGVNDCAVAYSLENNESTGYIGGIIGTGSNNAFAMRCYSRATMTGNATKGGIVGIYTTKHSFNRIFYCTYLEFTDSRP